MSDSSYSDAGLSPMRPVDPPGAYPSHLEQWVVLPSGDRVFLRPIVPPDVARLQYAFENADMETLRRRFFTGAPPSDRAHLEYLANVDYEHRLALLALDEEGNGVGIGRYEATEPGDAEVAIVVAPDWRRRGVGSAILLALEPAAVEHGITRFVALYLPDNKPVEALLMGIGYGDRRIVDGIAELVKPIA